MTDPIHRPHGVNQLVEIAGEEAAMALVREHGGGRVYVPQRPEGSALAATVGVDAARKLAEARGGETLEIPLWKRGVYAYHRRQGWSQARAARAAGVTDRTARNWDNGTARSLADALQDDLFS